MFVRERKQENAKWRKLSRACPMMKSLCANRLNSTRTMPVPITTLAIYLLRTLPALMRRQLHTTRPSIELEPKNARFVYRLGLLSHENLHGFAEAEIAYRRAIELAPADPCYYGGLVSLLVQQQRRSDALMLGARMRELLNVNENWYGLATLDAILGNVEEAIESLRKAADSDNFNREWARIDPDLAAIRGHDSFDEIVGIV